MMKILFCNIGWMEFYEGVTHSDQIIGGGAYISENGTGHEVCNFYSFNGITYGYVQPPSKNKEYSHSIININRIEKSKSDYIDGVLIVWTARHPKLGAVIIGWYKNAIVFKERQIFSNEPKLYKENSVEGYYIKTKTENVKLLSIDERVRIVPRGKKGFMGQSNIWYIESDESREFKKETIEYIQTYGYQNKKPKKGTSFEHRTKVEQSAIKTTTEYYESMGYTLISVEKDNLGWDLEAKLKTVKLKIEVKGLSGPNKLCQLTPNEYNAFKENSSEYRLAIVNDALNTCVMSICRFSAEKNSWITDTDLNYTVSINERVAAVIELNNKLNNK